jgi:lysine-ketoglutarate reductase/saccharopine dehydrogenase-like protein (TIGR00300 family)
VRARDAPASILPACERASLMQQAPYQPPDFSAEPLRTAPDATFQPAPADGVLPDNFFATSNLPTYVKLHGAWRLPRQPRMDGAIVRLPDGMLRIMEGRYVRAGQPVAVGFAEDGSQGIFVNATGFLGTGGGAAEFQFMSSHVSREKPVDYVLMADLLRRERDRGGHVVWVVGPAVLHSRGRDVLTWFIQHGYVGALLGGNAVAVHDIEQALLGTTLGMDRSGRPVRGGHAFHMRAINRIAAAGSIRAAVEQGVLTDGIMHACVTHDIPFVLAGSIRDDGPLPDTIRDTVLAQESMREHATRATMTIMIATALHSIAFGNMLPAYVVESDHALRPLTTIAVDTSEFVVSKLKDRGTHQAFGVITNAQDFLHVLRSFVAQPLERPAAPVAAV